MRSVLRRVSIRVKLAALASCAIVVVVLGQTLQALGSEAISVQEEIGLQARLITMSVAAAISPLWSDSTVPDLSRYAARIGDDLDVRSLALMRPDWEIVTYAGREPTEREIRRTTHLRLRTSPLSFWGLVAYPAEFLVTSPVLRGDEVRGYLLCVFRSEEPAARLRGLLRAAVVNLLLWSALGAGLTLAVTGKLTQPLVKLADDLRGVHREQYVMPPDGPSDGEIGLVQERLAQLSSHLTAERERVGELTTALEQQVEVISAERDRVAQQRETILDSVRDGILLVGADGHVTTANPRARSLFGFEPDDDRPIWSLVSEVDALRRAIHQTRDRSRSSMVQVSTLANHAGGEPTQLRVRVAPVVHPGREDAGVVMVAEDVTRSGQLEAQMMRSDRLAAIGTLTAGLAHQIGNQLSAIRGYSDLLTRRLQDRPDLLADLEVIKREIRNAVELMDKVLLLARTRPPMSAPIHIPTLLRETFTVVAPNARQHKVELVDLLETPGCSVAGDPQLFQQAILNLLINGIQAMPDGGRLEIRTRCVENRHCEVRIRDSGPGIPPENLQRVFDPFFTTKPVGEGTGLGLTIAHRILELHGAGIHIESSPPDGTTFVVELPLCQPKETDPVGDDG